MRYNNKRFSCIDFIMKMRLHFYQGNRTVSQHTFKKPETLIEPAWQISDGCSFSYNQTAFLIILLDKSIFFTNQMKPLKTSKMLGFQLNKAWGLNLSQLINK